MNAKNTNSKSGFTIIEVVLVLAIAGLIFLMVFIALPALQRNQRDTARKNEVSKVLAAVTSYQSNNRGSAPEIDDTFAKYLDGKYSQGANGAGNSISLESGTTVTIGTVQGGNGTVGGVTPDNIVLVIGSKCSPTDEGQVVDGTNRQAAALITLENADQVFCQSS